jgi:hypothetical protein
MFFSVNLINGENRVRKCQHLVLSEDVPGIVFPPKTKLIIYTQSDSTYYVDSPIEYQMDHT